MRARELEEHVQLLPRRGRVGDGGQCSDHPHGFANGRDSRDFVLPQHAQGAHIAQPVRDSQRIEEILKALVFGVAVAGFLGRHCA